MDGTMMEEPIELPLNATIAMAHMSMSLTKAQSRADSTRRRQFFFAYLPKEGGALRYAMSQDTLSGTQASSMNMYAINQSENGARRPGGGSYTPGFRPSRGPTGNTISRVKYTRPLISCPLGDGHRVPYGNAAFCKNFRNNTVPIRKDKVEKYVRCKK